MIALFHDNIKTTMICWFTPRKNQHYSMPYTRWNCFIHNSERVKIDVLFFCIKLHGPSDIHTTVQIKNLRGVLGSITCTEYHNFLTAASRTSNRKACKGSLCKQRQCCWDPFSFYPSIHSDILTSVTSNFKH